MKKIAFLILASMLTLMSFVNLAQNEINGYEYWFDNDFVGKTITAVIVPKQQLTVNQLISTSELSPGIHTFNFRTFDKNGVYSSVISSFFYKTSAISTNPNPKVAAYQYWLDNDFDNAVTVNTPAQQQVNINELISMASIANGIHTFNIRFKDNLNIWSSVANSFFYKTAQQTVIQNKIISFRYWIDDNFDDAIYQDLDIPVKQFVLQENIKMSKLGKGICMINFQFKDSLNLWSSVLSEEIEIIRPSAEYTEQLEICQNELPYTFGTKLLTESGTYVETFLTSEGVDSIVNLSLIVHPSYHVIYAGDDVVNNFNVDDDFEKDALGSLAGWTIKYNGTGTGNQKVVNHIAKNGTQSLQLQGAGSWSSEVYKPIGALPDKLIVEGWINPSIANAGGTGIGTVNWAVGSWGTRPSRIEFNGGNIYAAYTGGNPYLLQAFTQGEWYHVLIENDFLAKTYQVYINGKLANGTFNGNTVDVFPMHPTVIPDNIALCAGNATTTTVYFDDVKVYEQGTLKVCSNTLPFIFGTQELTESGVYTENFPTIHGCDSLVILKLEVLHSPNVDITINENTLTVAQENATYQWLDCENDFTPIEGATEQSFTPTQGGIYAVEVTLNGCTDTSICYAFTTVGVVDNTFNHDIVVYPNPTNGKVTIDLGYNYDEITLTVTSLNGQIIKQTDHKNQQVLELDLDVSEGIYLVSIVSYNRMAILKLVKN